MGLIQDELSLDYKPTYVLKTISEFLGGLSTINNVSDRVLRLNDFVNKLEEEMRKIDAFKRELPLCMLLINDAIVVLKEELMQCKKPNVEPVLEEFIPLKTSYDVDEKDEVRKEKDNKDKRNWMSSVQLWNGSDSSNTDPKKNQTQNSVVEIKKRAEEKIVPVMDDPYKSCKKMSEGRAFMSFKGYTGFPVAVGRKEFKEELPVAGLSLVIPGINNPREEFGSNGLTSKTSSCRPVSSSSLVGQSNLGTGPEPPQQQQTSRKQRRCWSPELHRRFVNALQQLGGSQVATPKQIRELMQVDGLTNDEVKSHLQKYRLHTRRVPSANAAAANQSVVLGGLLMPQDQYGESSKQSNSQSGSPQGPLQLTGTTGGNSTTWGDSMEDEEDEKSESYSWKSHMHTSVKDDV